MPGDVGLARKILYDIGCLGPSIRRVTASGIGKLKNLEGGLSLVREEVQGLQLGEFSLGAEARKSPRVNALPRRSR